MEVLLQKIDAIAKVNAEIIARISAKAKVTEYSYEITTVTQEEAHVLRCSETVTEIPTAPIIEEFKPTCSLTVITDIFNDKLSFECASFADLKRLNTYMPVVARKYELFGSTDKACKEVETFKRNLEIVQVALGELEEELLDEQSALPLVTQKVAAANAAIAELAAIGGVSFKIPSLPEKAAPQIPTTSEPAKPKNDFGFKPKEKKAGLPITCIDNKKGFLLPMFPQLPQAPALPTPPAATAPPVTAALPQMLAKRQLKKHLRRK